MSTEFQRYPWCRYRSSGNPEILPKALKVLEEESDVEKLESAYWKVDGNAVDQGEVYQVAEAVVPCLLAIIHVCKKDARVFVLELLVQIVSGEPANIEIRSGNDKVVEKCVDELFFGAATFFSILDCGTLEEKFHCIDLLGTLCLYDKRLKPRFVWWLELSKQAVKNEKELEFFDNWLSEVS